MARIEKGNSLRKNILQPGYTIHNDGYGLLTCTAVYKVDGEKVQDIARGTAFEPDPRLKCHKTDINYGPLGVATITAHYCGIAAGDWTEPNITGTSALTSESLTSHPNFFQTGTGSKLKKICGNPPYAAAFSITKLAPYAQVFEGDNGAIFETAQGGKFLGFYSKANSQALKLYQRTSYLAPTSSYNGILYTTKAENAIMIRDLVGGSMTARAPYGVRYLLPAFLGDKWTAADEDGQLLVASANFEDYGMLYKITYELRYNKEGWSSLVYPKYL
jgi:hypothetical protein